MICLNYALNTGHPLHKGGCAPSRQDGAELSAGRSTGWANVTGEGEGLNRPGRNDIYVWFYLKHAGIHLCKYWCIYIYIYTQYICIYMENHWTNTVADVTKTPSSDTMPLSTGRRAAANSITSKKGNQPWGKNQQTYNMKLDGV